VSITSYNVSLTSQPTHEVRVTPAIADPTVVTWVNSDGTPRTEPLIFGPNNWDHDTSRQRVYLKVTDDGNSHDNPPRRTTVSHTLTSQDSNYRGEGITSVTVTAIDNDAPGVILSRTVLDIAESGPGNSIGYVVQLNTAPNSGTAVTVRPMITNPGDGMPISDVVTITPEEYEFTAANWNDGNIIRRFTVTAVDNEDHDDPNRSAIISHEISISGTASGYENVNAPSLPVTVQNDDRPAVDAAVTVSTTTLNVSEARGTNSYTVVLRSQPSDTVTVTPVLTRPAGPVATPSSWTANPSAP